MYTAQTSRDPIAPTERLAFATDSREVATTGRPRAEQPSEVSGR